MELIEAKGEKGQPDELIIRISREEGLIMTEGLDHAGQALHRLNDAHIERGEEAPEGVPQPHDNYIYIAGSIASWLGLTYTQDVHFLDDAIKAEEELRTSSADRILEVSRNFREVLDAEDVLHRAEDPAK